MATPQYQLKSYLETLKTSDFECNVPFMYMDSVGKITVGVGHNLTDHGDWTTLPFIVARTERKALADKTAGIPIKAGVSGSPVGRAATKAEIENDYNFLAAHPGMHKYLPTNPNIYAYTTLELKSGDIDALFAKDIAEATRMARMAFPQGTFDAFPIPCQASLIDLQFNTGRLTKFTTLLSLIRGEGEYAKLSMIERWTTAATCCKRGKVSSVRNTTVANWFLEGAAQLNQAADATK